MANRWCGGRAQLEVISDRRGAAVWKATGPSGTVEIKAGTGEGAAITLREAHVLKAMGEPGRDVVMDRRQGLAWMVTPWFEGPSTWDALRGVREGRGDESAALACVIQLCEAVTQLHAAGWVHGDLQPQHSIHTKDGVRLIDCSWAWRRGFEPSYVFRGGLPHLLSPELAASVEAGTRPVAPMPADDVYALAAGVWWAVTGAWPLDYDAADIPVSSISAAQLREVIATRRVPLCTTTVMPSLLQMMAAALLAPSERRPTAAQLGRAVGLGS